MEPAAQWGEAFAVMISCASKLGTRVPYMGVLNFITIATLRY